MATKITTSRWLGSLSPSINDIGQLAEQAYCALPENFQAMCGNIVLRVEDLADTDLIENLGGNSPYDLLALFHPAEQNLDEASTKQLSQETPTHGLVIYRRAILDYWADTQESLDIIVTHIIVQEIGRQFGINDDELEKIETATLAEADRDTKALVQ